MAATLNASGLVTSDGSPFYSNAYGTGIGSYCVFFNSSGTYALPNTTISGSYLFYPSVGSGWTATGYPSGWTSVSTYAFGLPNAVNRTSTFSASSGVNLLQMICVATGTWRRMSGLQRTVYDPCSGASAFYPGLYVRIS